MFGGPFLAGRVLRIEPETRQRAERFYDRYGSWSLFFSWLPGIGDPLCLVGGILGVGFGKFLLLVFAGKLSRYLVVSLVTLKIVAL